MNQEYQLISVDIKKEVNKIPSAQLVLLDGEAAKQTFEISNSEFFEPGKEVELKLRYEGDTDVTVFKGIVVKQGVRADRSRSLLTVDVRDAAITLTTKRKNAVFQNIRDSQIIEQLIQGSGVKVGKIEETPHTHEEMVQYYSTDWDFILARADVNGLWVLTDDGSITVKSPDLKGKPKHTFEYGVSEIYEFEMETDIRKQRASVESTAWSVADQELFPPEEAEAFKLKQGNLDARKLAGKIGADTYTLIHSGDLPQGEIAAWANAKMSKDRLSMLQGRLIMLGKADIKSGDVITITGIGDRFNGNTLVTGIRHRVSVRTWRTEVQFGLPSDWFSQQDDIMTPPAAGLLPAVHGLQIGKVAEFEDDPEKKFRVRVKVVPINAPENVIWARLTSIDSGNNRGVFFRPEEGDEVILGFLNDDPRHPIILGSVHSEKNTVPYEVAAENYEKGIFTREQIKFLLHDGEKSIELSLPESNKLYMKDDGSEKIIELSTPTGNIVFMTDTDAEESIKITTPAGNTILMKDDEGITLEDQFGNKMITDDTGITVEDKNGNKLKGDDSGITIETGLDINVKGTNITIEGSKIDVN